MIYLDNNATTRPLPEVVEAVTEALRSNWGNPSSAHAIGRKAREALEHARHAVASAFGVASPDSLVFTASGTESINLAFACLSSPEVRQILVSATDHSAVLRAAGRWAEGRKVVQIPVDVNGLTDLEALHREAEKGPSLISVGLANNETGVLSDLRSVASISRETGAVLHVDAVQAAGKVPLHLDGIGCDAASLSAHKFHGPSGCGLLYLRKRPFASNLARVPAPGHHELGLRAGTENLSAIVGCAAAANLLQQGLDLMPHVSLLRDRLESAVLKNIPDSEVHGKDSMRLPNTTNLYIPGRNASDLVSALSRLGLAVSSGAACSNGISASHVIKAMGFTEERANSALRLSLSRLTTAEEAEAAISLMERAYRLTPLIGR